MKKRTTPKGMRMVRLEPDVATTVQERRVKNGRTVQGEVNTTLRTAYEFPLPNSFAGASSANRAMAELRRARKMVEVMR
jgi:thiazole synthase ThiGH ThiG subunit